MIKYILLLVVVVVAYFGFYIVRIYLYSHNSPNPSFNQQDVTLGSGPGLRYVAAGDSTAFGKGASALEKTYPYQIAEYYGQHNTVTYHNVAVSGAKTQDVIDKQLIQIIAFNPDVITLSVGANDMTHLIAAKTIVERLKKITETLTAQTSAKLFITNAPNFSGATILPGWYVSLLEKHGREINAVLGQLENDRVKVINIHDFGWDQFADRSVTYSADHFHPNDIGYKNWAQAFISRIAQ